MPIKTGPNFDDAPQDSSEERGDLTTQTLRGFKWTYLSTIIQFALGFITFTSLAHLLGPREFGIVNMATIFTNFIERVGFLGVGQALVQREKLTPAHVRCGFFLCLVFGFLLFVVFYFASPFIAAFFDEPEIVTALRVVSLSFVLACIAEVPACLLQRELRFKELLYITNVSFFLGYAVVGIVLAVLGFSYWSLIAAIVVARLVKLYMAFRALPQRLSLDFSRQEAKDLLHIGVGFSLGRLTNYCALVGDEFVTGKLLGAQALGLYSRAYQLMTAPATYFGQVLEKVLFAALAQRQNEPAKVAKYFLFGVELCSLVSVGGAVVLTVAAQEVVLALFGPKWIEAVPAVQILGLGVFFRTCYKNSDTVIRALGAVYRLAFRQTLYAIVVIGGTIIGSRWGLEGVAVAVLVSVFLNYVILSLLCLRLLSLPLSTFLKAHLPAVWVGSWQLLTLWTSVHLSRGAELNCYVTLLVGGIATGIVSILAFLVCPEACTPKVFAWLGKNVKLEKFGKAGKLGQSFLLRGSLPEPLAQAGPS